MIHEEVVFEGECPVKEFIQGIRTIGEAVLPANPDMEFTGIAFGFQGFKELFGVLPSWEVKIMDKSLIFIEKQVYKNVTHFGGQIPKGFEVFLRGHPCHIDGQFECDQSQYRSTDFHYAS